jgi:nondiscriminating glutamyl-tRNA synthetase
MTAGPIKTRFAPSPTGLLHLGNIRTALFNYLLAKKAGGTFLLRIEDTDIARGHENYVAALQEDLRWLGLHWQEGVGVGGSRGPYRQSERGAIYGSYFDQLERGERAYPCFCSEQELALERKAQIAAGRPPRYSGRCYRLTREEATSRLAAGTPATLRFHVEDGGVVEFDDTVRERQRFTTDDIGDFVIRRSSGAPAFFFSNAVDDALMGVTLVVRGDDHLSNTPRQILILEALGLPIPDYAHIALVVGADNAPLSKRSGSRTVSEMRAAGFLAVAIANYLARLGHAYESNALLDLDQLAAAFDLKRVSRSPARFDEKQLLHWQREAVRAAPEADLLEWMGRAVCDTVPADKRSAFVEAVRPNVVAPGEALDWARIIFTDDGFELGHWAKEAVHDARSKGFFDGFLASYERFADQPEGLVGRDPPWSLPTGVKRVAAFVWLRAALTGRRHGPELAQLLKLMSKERVQKRLRKAMTLNAS